MSSFERKNLKSFTLIELLVVLALVAILSVVVVMTLNPAELLKQARDSNRLSDLSTINTALNLFSADVTAGFMGTSTVVYVSIPDNASSTCGSLGLPTLPVGYTYNCVTTANLRNTNGTGWIPVNFQRISSNSPISQLPIDPQNTTSSGNYYTYVSGGSWILTAIPESSKQKIALAINPQLEKYPGVIGMGNNLNLSPLYNSNGLVGYWKFDEGSGITAKDSSGLGNDGSWGGTPVYGIGKVGNFAGRFTGSGPVNYVVIPVTSPGPIFTISAWINSSVIGEWQGIIGQNGNAAFFIDVGGRINYYSSTGYQGSTVLAPNTWYHVVATDDGSTLRLFLNGIIQTSYTANPSLSYIRIGSDGSSSYFNGSIDDVRIYNRAFSAAEVLALYNATK